MAIRDYLPLFLVIISPVLFLPFLYLIIWTASNGYWETLPIILAGLCLLGAKGSKGRKGMFS
jgi:hypothetical protein